MSKIEEVIVTISIDTECDHDVNWVRSKPLTFHSITEGIPNRLQPAFEQVEAVPTYLLTVEVMEDEASVEALRNLKGNYEYGTHLHAAFIEPEKKYYDYAGVDSPDFQCAYAADVEYQKLKNLSTLFENRLGYKPTSFRAGRYGASASSITSLERLGYKVDTSVTPHIRWREPNAVVDYRGAPEQPYFPAAGNIAQTASTARQILEVPVTVMPRHFRDPRWFRPWFATVDQMKDIFRYHIKKYGNRRVVSINMMFHSMEIIEKASPYPQSPDDVQRFIHDMQQTLHWCACEGVRFAPLSSLYDAFQDS